MESSISFVSYRQAQLSDIPAIARLRGPDEEGGAAEERMARYLAGEHHPQHALMPRVLYVALGGDAVVGYIAGHLTRRYGCDGELQWIYVIPEHRGSGVASELLCRLAAWFVEQKAARVCVDVTPTNTRARRFYTRHGAVTLKPYWLVWDDIGVVQSER
jgi:ribosomal protein S18 acetylase RimI-like enzyme